MWSGAGFIIVGMIIAAASPGFSQLVGGRFVLGCESILQLVCTVDDALNTCDRGCGTYESFRAGRESFLLDILLTS